MRERIAILFVRDHAGERWLYLPRMRGQNSTVLDAISTTCAAEHDTVGAAIEFAQSRFGIALGPEHFEGRVETDLWPGAIFVIILDDEDVVKAAGSIAHHPSWVRVRDVLPPAKLPSSALNQLDCILRGSEDYLWG